MLNKVKSHNVGNKTRMILAIAASVVALQAQAQWTKVGAVIAPTVLTDNVSVGTTVNGANIYAEKSNAVTLGIKSTTAGATMFMDKGVATANAAFAYKTLGVTLWNSGMLGSNNFTIRNVSTATNPFVITQTDQVGIGTGAPINKLTVIANSASGVGIYSPNTLNTFLTIGRNFTGDMTLGVPDGPNNFLNGTVAGDGVLRVENATKKLVFGAGIGVNPTMVVTSSNVGIGTSTPTNPLTIVSAPANIPALQINPSSGNARVNLAVGDWSILQDYFGSGVSKDFSLYQNSKGLHRMLIDTAGNMGIGTITPGSKLHVLDQGTTNVTGIIYLQSPNMPATGSLTALVMGKNVAADGNQAELRYEYNGDNDVRNGYAFGMNNIQPFVRFTQNSRVSIGNPIGNGANQTPDATLDVQGNIKIADGTEGAGKLLTSDANGLATWQAPTPAVETDPQVSSATTNKVPRWDGTSLVDGLISDNGVQLSIGSTPLYGMLDIVAPGGLDALTLRRGASNPWLVGPASGTGFVSKFGIVDNVNLRLIIDATGNTGIGTPFPTAKLSVNGTADKPGGGSWAVFSDARLKQNVNNYDDGLSTLLKINPVTYHYNEKSGCDTKPEYVGVIAQELQKVAPYMVDNFTKDGADYLRVDNSAMTYMLINSVKELAKQNELKDAKNAELQNVNVAMQNQLNEMQQCVQTLCASAESKTQNSELQTSNTLFQNQPNPFNQTTVISYQLLSDAKNATIVIRGLNGEELKSVTLSNTSNGQVTINANELAQGTYTYTLIVNGKSVDTKLMVVTK